MSFEIKNEFGKFDEAMRKLVKETGNIVPQCLFAGAAALKEDSIRIKPTVPKDTGDLRASIYIEVKGHEAFVIFPRPQANRLEDPDRDPKNPNWSEPGSGKKYVRQKIETRNKVYLQVIADKYASLITKA